MFSSIVLLILAIIIVIAAFLILKNIGKLIIYMILGLAILFFTNLFNLMALFGNEDIVITPLTLIICMLGGPLGALLVILLTILGYPLPVGDGILAPIF